jgi:hypothetical protein
MQQSITTQFNIGVSTLMIGPMDKVLELTPEEHSIGLIKNLSTSAETSEVTLTQGIRNVLVDSQVTGSTVQITTEVYEYTAKNIALAAQLAGEEFSLKGNYKLKTAITGGVSATSVVLKGVPSSAQADLAAGDTIALQCTSTKDYDKIWLGKVAETPTWTADSQDENVGDLSITLTAAIPAGWDFAADDSVFYVNLIPVGSDEPQPYYAVKIVGILPNGNEPFTIVCPKAKITAGFNISFTTDNYGNMPFQITPYDLTKEDYDKYPFLRTAFKNYTAPMFVYKG